MLAIDRLRNQIAGLAVGLRPGTWGTRAGLGCVLLVYVALAFTYNVTNPLFEAPDEIWHYLYARQLASGGGIPRDEGREHGFLAQQEAAQPPLYYAVAAALTFWAPREDLAPLASKNEVGSFGDVTTDGNKNVVLHSPRQDFPWPGEVMTIHLTRATTTLWGIVTVVFTFLAARAIFRSGLLAVAAAAVVAFTPEFLFMSAAVNNDVAVSATCAILLWLAIRVSGAIPRPGAALALGAVAGAVILTKPIAAGAPVIVAVALWMAARHTASPRKAFLRSGVIALIGCVAVCGWWFAYNLSTYGSLLPLQSFLSRSALFDKMPTPIEFVRDLASLRYSYWAVFGWFSILAPPEFYQYVNGLVFLAGLGLVVFLVRGKRRPGESVDRSAPGIFLAATLLLAIIAGVSAYRLVVLAFHGRLLFGATSAIAILLILGWSRLAPGRRGETAALVLAVSLVVPAALFPWLVIAPSYTRLVARAEASVQPGRNVDARFGDLFSLIGVDLDPLDRARLHPGETVEVKVYLKDLVATPKNYLLMVKLLDFREYPVSEFHTHPGHGANPTSEWKPDQVYVDTYRLHVPDGTTDPAIYHAIVGFYDFDARRNLPVLAADGRPMGGTLRVGTFAVRGRPDLARSAKGLMFRNGNDKVISLVEGNGLNLTAHPGDAVGGGMLFGGIAPVSQDYTVFVHIEDSGGRLIAQDDDQPGRGRYPTSWWEPGDLVRHDWEAKIPPSAARGDYALIAGWYELASGQRLLTDEGNSLRIGVLHLQ